MVRGWQPNRVPIVRNIEYADRTFFVTNRPSQGWPQGFRARLGAQWCAFHVSQWTLSSDREKAGSSNHFCYDSAMPPPHQIARATRERFLRRIGTDTPFYQLF